MGMSVEKSFNQCGKPNKPSPISLFFLLFFRNGKMSSRNGRFMGFPTFFMVSLKGHVWYPEERRLRCTIISYNAAISACDWHLALSLLREVEGRGLGWSSMEVAKVSRQSSWSGSWMEWLCDTETLGQWNINTNRNAVSTWFWYLWMTSTWVFPGFSHLSSQNWGSFGPSYQHSGWSEGVILNLGHTVIHFTLGSQTWVCLKIRYIPNEIAIYFWDNDH